MAENPKKTLRPYELTGPEYALWYDVGHFCGMVAQTAVERMLCEGHQKLEFSFGVHIREVDAQSRAIIEGLAKQRGIDLYRAT